MVNEYEHNPALADLAFLAGEWDMEVSNAPFLPTRDDTAHGHVTFAWIEEGAFLVMRQSEQFEHPPRRGGPSAGTDPAPPSRSSTPTSVVSRGSMT